ncbi:agamous-like MADS-box protein AGL80 [Salvia hispanica]|uniref:agamous-like MADS-box protein AGL80 n=1 Tax=Salvia hispanica TaxID=49212 RepID=UPI0020099C75|nr:agamous-like MADS-box protein AGL80 [Salvia hispanica]
MTRKKVTLAYITNDSERKASYKKRKKGLIKKVSELSTLCGVPACVIIYSQYDPVPVVWPSPLEAQSILARFRKLSIMDQTRKMVNQESFTRQRIKKATEQLRRLQKENSCRELEAFMFRCILGQASLNDLRIHDVSEMSFVIGQTLRDIKARMDAMAAEHQRNLAAPPPPPLPPLLPPPPMLALPPPPPPTTVEEAPVRMEDDGMESFPWNLVQSPGGGGDMEGTGLGWDPGMVLPYPYDFDQSSSSYSGQNPNRNLDPNPNPNPNPNPTPFNK